MPEYSEAECLNNAEFFAKEEDWDGADRWERLAKEARANGGFVSVGGA